MLNYNKQDIDFEYELELIKSRFVFSSLNKINIL